MNWKLIFFPAAVVVELTSVAFTGREIGFGNWVMDRKLGDPKGKPFQTRQQIIDEQHRKQS